MHTFLRQSRRQCDSCRRERGRIPRRVSPCVRSSRDPRKNHRQAVRRRVSARSGETASEKWLAHAPSSGRDRAAGAKTKKAPPINSPHKWAASESPAAPQTAGAPARIGSRTKWRARIDLGVAARHCVPASPFRDRDSACGILGDVTRERSDCCAAPTRISSRICARARRGRRVLERQRAGPLRCSCRAGPVGSWARAAPTKRAGVRAVQTHRLMTGALGAVAARPAGPRSATGSPLSSRFQAVVYDIRAKPPRPSSGNYVSCCLFAECRSAGEARCGRISPSYPTPRPSWTRSVFAAAGPSGGACAGCALLGHPDYFALGACRGRGGLRARARVYTEREVMPVLLDCSATSRHARRRPRRAAAMLVESRLPPNPRWLWPRLHRPATPGRTCGTATTLSGVDHPRSRDIGVSVNSRCAGAQAEVSRPPRHRAP